MTQQQQPRIGIVIGSTREGRFGEKPAHWIHEIAKQRTDLAFELIDLRDHPLPFFNEPRSPAYGPVNNEAARLWAGKLATLDGLIIVTPEYNRGIPGVLKNAIDVGSRPYGSSVWNAKPAAVVSNSPGAIGGFGARVFAAYEEAWPLAPGHETRVALYQLYPLMVHVNLFGGGYVGSVEASLDRLA